jgi:uncharacterized protein YdeI (YjbR/CyaY-like superfamily)
MCGVDEVETTFFEGPEELEAWLDADGETADEIWVQMAKKSTGVLSLDWTGAVEVALCFGWIDGKSWQLDDSWHLQRFTPRRPRSSPATATVPDDLAAAPDAAGLAEAFARAWTSLARTARAPVRTCRSARGRTRSPGRPRTSRTSPCPARASGRSHCRRARSPSRPRP